MSDLVSDLTRIRAVAELKPEELRVFEQMLSREVHRPHRTLVRQGAIEPNLFYLARGHVNVTRQTPEGEVFLTLLSPGAYFGEGAIFDDQLRTATVRTVDEVEVFVISRDQFQAFVDLYPAIAAKVLFGMFREHLDRLQKTSRELTAHRAASHRQAVNNYFT